MVVAVTNDPVSVVASVRAVAPKATHITRFRGQPTRTVWTPESILTPVTTRVFQGSVTVGTGFRYENRIPSVPAARVGSTSTAQPRPILGAAAVVLVSAAAAPIAAFEYIASDPIVSPSWP